MAQHDYVIANGTGAAVRSDLNNGLAAIVSQNSGTTEPTTTYAYMRWADTTAGVMKMRNGANNAWISLYQLDGEWSTIAFENGSASAPSIYFKDSGTDTGIYSPGTDQVAISTGGSGRLFINSSGNVGLGTSSPNAKLEINTGTDENALLLRRQSGDPVALVLRTFNDANKDVLVKNDNGALNLYTGNPVLSRLYIHPAGRVGIGTTTPGANLQVTATGSASKVIVNSDISTSALASRIELGNSVGSARFTIGLLGGGGETAFLGPEGNFPIYFQINGAERARIDTSGRLLVGTSTNVGGETVQFHNTTGNNLAVGRFVNSNGSGDIAFYKSRSGTIGANTAVNSGDNLGVLSWKGADGTNYIESASISTWIDGTPGTNDMPGRLVFSTTADGASSPTERMVIYSNGVITATSSRSDDFGFRIITNTGNQYNLGLYKSADQNTVNEDYIRGTGGATTRFKFVGNGGLYNYQANNANLSDRNTKKDISPAADTWNCIKEWEIVNYRYKDQPDDADLSLGVIAQQVAESCPEVITVFEEAKEAKPVVLDEDGNEIEPAQEAQPEKLGVKEQQMYWMAIKALQEAMSRIETLESEVAALKTQ